VRHRQDAAPWLPSKVRRALGGIRARREGFRTSLEIANKVRVTFHALRHLISFAQYRDGACALSTEPEILPITCQEVRKELADYMEDDISPELRSRIDRHFEECAGCFAIYDDLRKVIRLMSSKGIIELPEGFSVRLYQRIAGNSPF